MNVNFLTMKKKLQSVRSAYGAIASRFKCSGFQTKVREAKPEKHGYALKYLCPAEVDLYPFKVQKAGVQQPYYGFIQGLKTFSVVGVIFSLFCCTAVTKENSSLAQDLVRYVRVKKDDTVYTLAQKHHVTTRAIILENKLTPPYRLYISQVLRIPPPPLHRVRKNQTLSHIALLYKVGVKALCLFNNIPVTSPIHPGQILYIPRVSHSRSRGSKVIPKKMSKPPRYKPVLQARATSKEITFTPKPSQHPHSAFGISARLGASPKAGKTNNSPPNSTTRPPKSDVKLAKSARPPKTPIRGKPQHQKFIWPLKQYGQMLTAFGQEGATTQDGITLEAPAKTPVQAIQAGEIVYAGNELKGFGNLVLIRHKQGWISAYAHLGRIVVKQGERVKQRTIIGDVGQSGNATSPQLYFELRQKDRPVNPVNYMTGPVNSSVRPM